ncbi:MAG: asparagine synthase B, partial [Christiangramia sp.]|nr:asparagine synthase B [Christiangramia sp.]
MCGILAVIGKDIEAAKISSLSKRMSHRGPDESGIKITEKGHVLAHERLSIVDLTTGIQPIQGTSSAWMVHNGEIYNHMALRNNELKDHSFRTTGDSEVIVHMYEKYGVDFVDKLDGVFSFVVIDGDDFIVGRDP